jgi:hypothetical protein
LSDITRTYQPAHGAATTAGRIGNIGRSIQDSSWPGSTRLRCRSRFGAAKARPSTPFFDVGLFKNVDARDKPGHDVEVGVDGWAG